MLPNGSNGQAGSLPNMAFDIPAPDLSKLIVAWDEWEKGEESPGKVLSKLKTAGLPAVLAQLRDTGWTPLAATAAASPAS